MRRDDLVEVVNGVENGPSTKVAARAVVDAVFEAMLGALKKDDEVAIHGFGTFKVKQRAARTARNPHTGESIKVPAKKALAFKPASSVKAFLNDGKKAKKG